MHKLFDSGSLKYPLKQVGERGKGKWERISWDEAYNIIVEKLQQIIDEDGADSIALGAGTGRHHCNFVPRFANAIGTPNLCEPGTAQCFFPQVNVSFKTFGDLPICDFYGEVKPDCILVWGQNPLKSGPDGELQFHSRALTRTDTKVIVVDPRETYLAKKADVWLQVRPGTDDALALSKIHVIVTEKLYDKAFVENWTYGFDQFPFLREHLPEEAKKKRLGAGEFRVLGEGNLVPSAHIPAVFNAMRNGEPYPIRAFLIFGNNPLATYANSKLVLESLMKVEFLTVMDLFMTPSAEYADLVLPAASWLELDCATVFPFFAEMVALP
jgi:anaerobic selenocysteine-containing dehydrogenase